MAIITEQMTAKIQKEVAKALKAERVRVKKALASVEIPLSVPKTGGALFLKNIKAAVAAPE